MKKIETSALIGLGALGILFGRKMPGVKVIADAERVARYSAQPVVCNGKECHFDYVTPEQGQPVDLVLVAVKATVLEQAIKDIKKFVGPDTIIISVLNGITSENDIEAVYPGHCLWSVAIGMDATRVGRSLTFGAEGRIQFGEKSGGMTDRVKAVDEYLTACGIASEPCSDILFKQWSKLMVNDGLNQAAAAFDLPYGGLTKPGPAYDKMIEAMQEVIDLSVLEGVNLPADNHKAFLESMAPTFNPDGMPSMRQDVLAKRPTEVEQFAGVVRRLAKKHGMPTPANDFFYEKIREIESTLTAIEAKFPEAAPKAPGNGDSIPADSPTTPGNGDKTQKFPAFEGKDLNGNPVKSDDLFSKNAVTVVNFWFTTCNPCVGELSELDALNKELAKKGGALIGVNTFTLDGDEAAISEAKDVLSKKGATYRNVYFDSDSEAGKFTANIFAYPTTYVVDRSGNIVGDPIVGAVTEKKQAETLQKLIDQVLAADKG